jgi:leader peptidase (prepilin peptidase)/N-methyltransferase
VERRQHLGGVMTDVPVFFVAIVGLLGLAIGSFLNVVIYRVPRGESITSPGSHCPRCDTAIKARHNVPVLGWLVLRGKCASCRAPISVRYPAVELGTAVLMMAITVRFGFTAQLPAYLFFAAVAITLALIDVDLRKLPNVLVVPAYVVAILLLALASLSSGEWGRLARGAAGLVVFGVVAFGFKVAWPRQLTLGDVQLAGLLGLYLGWLSWAALAVGAAAGVLVGALALTMVPLLRLGLTCGMTASILPAPHRRSTPCRH